jgi:protein-L-isoaspartate(D-aspartate) O-methyltransferase
MSVTARLERLRQLLCRSSLGKYVVGRGMLKALAGIAVLFALPAHAGDNGETIVKRHALVQDVRHRLHPLHVPQDAYLEAVMAAIGTVPRHELVPAESRARAYEDTVLEIGYGQTISDPFIVALMTDLLRVGRQDTVLEVGTGSGYQAAVLGQIVRKVYTVEIVGPLAKLATDRLGALGYSNITVRAGDGYAGWPDHAPFDGIIVTAGAPCLPPALVAQLKPGGRMVIPLGRNLAVEELMVVTKRRDGELTSRSLGRVMFVDFTGTIERASRLGPYPRHDPHHPLTLCDISPDSSTSRQGKTP